jgi:phage-related minor tail protein
MFDAQDKIAQLKAKMAANAKEWDERNRLLREEREVMQGHLRELKSQMNELHELERSRLAKLTMDSNAALKQLKKKIEKVSKKHANCLLQNKHKHNS